MESILQNNKMCYVCGCCNGLELHHCIYGTAKRELSEKYGLTIWLCREHHRTGKNAVHFYKPLDENIKRYAQEQAMKHYKWNIEDWMRIFRRNYL